MKLGKKLAATGLAFGILGSLLFYASPDLWLTHESHLACPSCPYVDSFPANPMNGLKLGLKLGLVSGSLFALLGFGAGYCITRLRRRTSAALGSDQNSPV
jgi:hypothetical protein